MTQGVILYHRLDQPSFFKNWIIEYYAQTNRYSIAKTSRLNYFTISSHHSIYEDLKSFYLEEIVRIDHESFSNLPYGRSISSIQRSLISHVAKEQHKQQQHQRHQEKQQKQYLLKKQLRDFVRNIKDSSSGWYSGWGHSNRKGKAFQQILDFCNQILKLQDWDTNKIINILKITITIALIPRGKTNNAKKIGAKKDIDQTNSANAALNAALRVFKNKKFYVLNNFLNLRIDNYEDLLTFAEIDNFHILYNNVNKVLCYSQAENLTNVY
ncbi:MAG: hypothetical protein GY710_14585 [Desulfobacteraceae bacterium]|nr:hypothetical protein [Desulfobacteraceae bacterium]